MATPISFRAGACLILALVALGLVAAQPAAAARRGSVTVKVEPSSGQLDTVIRPPMADTMRLATQRPTPKPPPR